MFIKVITILVLFSMALAQHDRHYHHHATSYVSSNNYKTHSSHDYHHGESALLKVTTPLETYHTPSHHHSHHSLHSTPVFLKTSHHEEHHHTHPKYQFKYGVHDSHTHDIKDQEESRDGDVVKGSYTLLQPAGRTRTVHYSSDKHNGFQADVEYSGHAEHPEEHHKAIVAPSYYHHHH